MGQELVEFYLVASFLGEVSDAIFMNQGLFVATGCLEGSSWVGSRSGRKERRCLHTVREGISEATLILEIKIVNKIIFPCEGWRAQLPLVFYRA